MRIPASQSSHGDEGKDKMIFTIDTPIKDLHPAKTPPTWLGEFLEDTLPLCVFAIAMTAFLWMPAFLGI